MQRTLRSMFYLDQWHVSKCETEKVLVCWGPGLSCCVQNPETIAREQAPASELDGEGSDRQAAT